MSTLNFTLEALRKNNEAIDKHLLYDTADDYLLDLDALLDMMGKLRVQELDPITLTSLASMLQRLLPTYNEGRLITTFMELKSKDYDMSTFETKLLHKEVFLDIISLLDSRNITDDILPVISTILMNLYPTEEQAKAMFEKCKDQ